MNVKRIISIALAMLVMSFVAPVYANAQAPPSLPHSFYGALEVNGSNAEPGYTVKAEGLGVVANIEGNPITTEFLGEYGRVGPLQPRLIVQGDIDDGAELKFHVSSDGVTWVEAETEPASVAWHSGEKSRVDLSATIAAPLVGGGGGGGGDTTPPAISDIGTCREGVTETTADICWTTNEPSTSQVEYWASPGTLSPLKAELVIGHHVLLTGLTPATTYHYKTMSKDAAGNLAVSDEDTFTTKEAPAEPEPEPAPAPPPEPPAPAPAPAPPAPPTPAPPEVEAAINWPLIGGLIAAAVIIGLVIFFWRRRRAY